jgi:hypothetical protein
MGMADRSRYKVTLLRKPDRAKFAEMLITDCLADKDLMEATNGHPSGWEMPHFVSELT